MKSSPKSSNVENVLLDLNSPVFQRNLVSLGKDEKLQALKTLGKILEMTWAQVYSDQGLKWEKVTSIPVPAGLTADAVYTLRINKACRATAIRQGQLMRLLAIEPNHDAVYGKK